MSEVIAEIRIAILDDRISWDIGKLTLPEVVFWLEAVKGMIMSQVQGDAVVQEGASDPGNLSMPPEQPKKMGGLI